MKQKCPKCKCKQEVNVLKETKSEDAIDKLGHFHLECKSCGWQFNHWAANREVVKKIYGDSYDIYQ